jgi:hypothetical protein
VHLFILIPLILIGSIVIVFGLIVFLGRFKNGKYLRPIVNLAAKVPWLRKQLLKMNQAVIERQNPELASAMRKIQRVGPTADPKKLQQAYQSLTPDERRAYQEVVDQQGGAPEATNRQMRRAQERMAQSNRSSGSRPTGGNSKNTGSNSKRGKKR